MVEGGSSPAHRPGHVPENLIPKELDEDALIDAVVVPKPAPCIRGGFTPPDRPGRSQLAVRLVWGSLVDRVALQRAQTGANPLMVC